MMGRLRPSFGILRSKEHQMAWTHRLWRASWFVSGLACFCIGAGVGLAQPVARVSIGSPVLTMAPDLEVPVPVNINAPGDGLVSIAIELAYPTKLLKYDSAKPGSTLERAKAKVRVVEKAGEPGSDEQVLTIEIESPQPLTAGTLVTLNFRPTDAVTGRTEVPIRNISRSAKSAGGQEVKPQGSDGKVTLTPMVFSCFFYMH
jgi:hypothetical protein